MQTSAACAAWCSAAQCSSVQRNDNIVGARQCAGTDRNRSAIVQCNSGNSTSLAPAWRTHAHSTGQRNWCVRHAATKLCRNGGRLRAWVLTCTPDKQQIPDVTCSAADVSVAAVDEVADAMVTHCMCVRVLWPCQLFCQCVYVRGADAKPWRQGRQEPLPMPSGCTNARLAPQTVGCEARSPGLAHRDACCYGVADQLRVPALVCCCAVGL